MIHKVTKSEYANYSYVFFSESLNYYKQVDIFLPFNYATGNDYPLVIMNDGQDAKALMLKECMYRLQIQNLTKPFVVAAIHASERDKEYGIASKLDYTRRGGKAAAYTKFICSELIPFLQSYISIGKDTSQYSIIGMSLGGLSAFDIAWHNNDSFGIVGIFSGSFWWRSRALDNGYFPNHRILQNLLANDLSHPKIKFWFEVGTKDEKSDRNNSGIIDAIEDTLDVIQLLRFKGYRLNQEIKYVEVKDGRHDLPTWAAVLPAFFYFAYPLK